MKVIFWYTICPLNGKSLSHKYILNYLFKKQLDNQSLKKSNQNITTVILKRADIDMGTFITQHLALYIFWMNLHFIYLYYRKSENIHFYGLTLRFCLNWVLHYYFSRNSQDIFLESDFFIFDKM